jgi:hypothetical protein
MYAGGGVRGRLAMKRPVKRADKTEIALVPGREIALFTIGVVPMTEESKVELAVLAFMAAAMTPNRRIVPWFVNRSMRHGSRMSTNFHITAWITRSPPSPDADHNPRLLPRLQPTFRPFHDDPPSLSSC